MLKIVMATGGTGGHLFPSRQLRDELLEHEVVFAGHGLKHSPFFDRNIPHQEIVSSSSKWGVFFLLKGLLQSLLLLVSFKPDLVIGFGSYHSFPVLAAAILLRKKVILFEPNCSLGKVNRFFAPFAHKIAFQFPIFHKKAAYVPPLPWKKGPKRLSNYQKDPERITILVFGGSQGARFINETFCMAARELNFPFRVIHFTGKTPFEGKYLCPSIVKPFEEDMQSAYEVADLAVCRSGAGTIAELIRHQLPAVIIPYPHAHGHQELNALFLKDAVRRLDQKQTTPTVLAKEIESLRENLEMHKAGYKQIALPRSAPFKELIETIGESS